MTSTSPSADFDAVILAGGRARRLGGAQKPDILVGGRPVWERVAGAVAEAERLIVVGPRSSAPERAIVVREDPPGAGPVPALVAGLAEVRAHWVAVLAADLPFLRVTDITALREAASTGFLGDGAVALDAEGHDQWLLGVWRVAPLRAAASTYEGSSLRGLLGSLRPVRFALHISSDTPPPWLDCDTRGDVETARQWVGAEDREDRTGADLAEPPNRRNRREHPE